MEGPCLVTLQLFATPVSRCGSRLWQFEVTALAAGAPHLPLSSFLFFFSPVPKQLFIHLGCGVLLYFYLMFWRVYPENVLFPDFVLAVAEWNGICTPEVGMGPWQQMVCEQFLWKVAFCKWSCESFTPTDTHQMPGTECTCWCLLICVCSHLCYFLMELNFDLHLL